MAKKTGPADIIILAAVLMMLSGCGHDILYSHHVKFGEETWNRETEPRFTATIEDTSSVASVDIILRTGSDYPYRNIWLFVSAFAPGGESRRDTIEYMLSDEKGERFGKGSGDIRELTLKYRQNIFFSEKGQYVFLIEHAMRDEDLEGVYDIGIRIRREPEKVRR